MIRERQSSKVAQGHRGLTPKMQLCDYGTALPEVRLEALDQVAGDRIAKVRANERFDETYEAWCSGHGVSSPTSRPAAIARSADNCCWSTRRPAAETR